MSSLTKDEYIFMAELRYHLRKFLHFSETASRDAGITPQQHQLMLAVMGFPDRDYATPGELAERLQITHHACVGLIDRCEQIGLVIRKANPRDGRSVLIELTEKGKVLLEKLSVNNLAQIKKLGLYREP